MVPNAFNLRNREAEASGSHISANLVYVVSSRTAPAMKTLLLKKKKKFNPLLRGKEYKHGRGLWNQSQKQERQPLF